MNSFLSRTLMVCGLLAITIVSTHAQAKMAEGLNVVVTTSDRQAQLMSMVLSMQTLKAHKKKVNMILCGSAGDLALKSTKTAKMKPRDVSPTMLLKKIIKLGAKVEVCPLYLPNAGKDKSELIDGISVANPKQGAADLLNPNFQNLTY